MASSYHSEDAVAHVMNLDRMLRHLPQTTQESIHMSISGMSHRAAYTQLPMGHKARSKLLASVSAITLHDVPLWTVDSGDTLVNIGSAHAYVPKDLIGIPACIKTTIRIEPRPGVTSSAVGTTMTVHMGLDIPVVVVLAEKRDRAWTIVFGTVAGSLVCCNTAPTALPSSSASQSGHISLTKRVLASCVIMCSASSTTVYYLSKGSVYSAPIDKAFSKDSLCQFTKHSTGVDALTHLSTTQTEAYVVSASGIVYSCSGHAVIRMFGLQNSRVVSFAVTFYKQLLITILFPTMVAQVCDECGNVSRTFSAVLSVLQTTDKCAILLFRRKDIIVLYRDAVYSVVLHHAPDWTTADKYSTRLVSASITGNEMHILIACATKWSRVVATLKQGTPSKAQSKSILAQPLLSTQIIHANVRSANSHKEGTESKECFDFMLAGHETVTASIYFTATTDVDTSEASDVYEESSEDEDGNNFIQCSPHCIYSSRCEAPSLCAMCLRKHSAESASIDLPQQLTLRWYVKALADAGRCLDKCRAERITKLVTASDDFIHELAGLTANKDLVPWLQNFFLNIQHLILLVRTGTTGLVRHAALALVRQYGASTPWITALVCRDANLPQRHLYSLASLFAIQLQCLGIPVLGMVNAAKTDT